VLSLVLWLAGCAVPFPVADSGCCTAPDELTADEIFERTWRVHGGQTPGALKDLNVALDGRWKFLITRIQPLVTDHRYRVRSQERLLLPQGVYAARYEGPAGSKQVYRSRSQIRVWYDGQEVLDEDVLASTALTADSFLLFALGPLAPAARRPAQASAAAYQRLPDREEGGRRYHRLYRVLTPGLGLSDRDELVLWVDARTARTWRVQITLEGYRTTRGAHVDVTYLDYKQVGAVLLPVAFNERVRGPIAITAHRWWLTGLDLNRGLEAADLQTMPWQREALTPAKALD
jgi:hypothetical protein